MSDVLDSYPLLLRGAWTTLQITLLGAALALVLALVVGLAGTARSAVLRAVNRIYVEFFRGIAALVLMYWFFYALPLLGLRFTPIAAAVLAVGLNYGAYGAEVVRGSINAVPRAQWEAACALNFTAVQRMRRVLLPQATALMLPPFGNLLIELMKATAGVSLVAIADLTFRAKQIQASTGQTAATFAVILVIYFVIAQALQVLVRLAERRSARMLGRGLPPRPATAAAAGPQAVTP
ncbi:ectoine/hydroxyectoine ABC transporter permease subunit EhuC [Actinomadura logoneensis]|uniref:Ectoine/hydroxyectoine ABC transporter permease subunit EhuC n=1 Tax=Actinomadura logoneensis TaxID=2293572 RepID=A0A372JG30_9ACTN|nr:ectoine/hydroxyectoine ABC transporter permease subunit EhuC [Actinomadura logoneensis]RFU38951.1 ectoine/hydroxyectoine ABC transporter permease subunit EhuC [Actinomadura logoneensis]